jgi:hypothetical protein
VTGIAFRDDKYFLTCSLDNVLSFFDLAQADPDDMIDGAYASTQPILACGYLNEMVIWVQTSVNTVELVRVEDATLFQTIDQVSQHIRSNAYSSPTTLTI